MLKSYSLSYLLILCLPSGQISVFGASFNPDELRGEVVTETHGAAGETCGYEVFKCAKEARCVNNTCQCPYGTVGVPYFKCVSDDHYSAFVTGDPRVHGFDGGSSKIPYPCRIELAHIQNYHNIGKGGTCDLQIHIINYHFRKGYYTLGYDLQGFVTDYGNPNFPGHFHFRNFGFNSNGTFAFEEQGKNNAVHRQSLSYNGHPHRYLKHVVEASYDNNTNMAIAHVEACGVWTYFKPKIPHSHQMSGFAVIVKKGPFLKFVTKNYPLAFSPFTRGEPAIMQVKKLLKLTKTEATLYLALIQRTGQNFGGDGMACALASQELSLMCRNVRLRAFAVKICGFLYIDDDVSCCLRANTFGASTGNLFGMCVQAMCLQHRLLCEVVKSQLKIYRCPTPFDFHSLDCSKITELLDALYPYRLYLPRMF